MNKLKALLVFVLGASASIWAGVLALMVTGAVGFMGLATTGSGGVGAVSSGLAEMLVEALPVVVPMFFVRLASRLEAARNRRGLVRGYWITTLLLVVLPVAGAAMSLIEQPQVVMATLVVFLALQSIAGAWSTALLVKHYLTAH